MEVSVGISNRHVHLNNDDYKILFGDRVLEKKIDLKQPNTFASTLTVSIKGSKSIINNVRVLGPNRDYTQVEVSRTDSYTLGINPPIRTSGDLRDASLITIIGPKGEIRKECCIIANRHIHLTKAIREEKGLTNIDMVKVKINNIKGGILDNVYLKESEEAYFEIHLDMDDANALYLNNNDLIEIIQ